MSTTVWRKRTLIGRCRWWWWWWCEASDERGVPDEEEDPNTKGCLRRVLDSGGLRCLLKVLEGGAFMATGLAVPPLLLPATLGRRLRVRINRLVRLEAARRKRWPAVVPPFDAAEFTWLFLKRFCWRVARAMARGRAMLAAICIMPGGGMGTLGI